ncbi:RNA polymerase factor sigma-54 [Candidatus Latescibacterota bacterium]
MLRLAQEMKLQHKLDFRMIQSLKLLPLTITQLEQRINEELEQNPMLMVDEAPKQEEAAVKERVSGNGQADSGSAGEERGGDFTEAEWTTYLEDGFDSYSFRGEYDPNYEERESTQTYVVTLADHLMEQLGMMITSEKDRQIGEFIIGGINSEGFLELLDEEIAAGTGASLEDVARMVRIIQRFDPAGIGARTLRETLLLQLEDRGNGDSVAWKITKDHFDEFKNRKHIDIMRALGITEDELREAIEQIGTLTPRPGAVFDDTQNTAVIPDIIVEKIDDEYVLMHNDRHIPHLNINSRYRGLLDKNAGTSRETRKYLVDKLNSAKWFINSIEQRRSTIMKVATEIVNRQREFLEHGVLFLRPMTLQDVADNIGMAISTVQRVTTGKYIQTPKGVFEMKYFFTQRIASSNGQEDFSAKTVKEKMKEIIAEENTKKPLSDQKIANMLNRQGVAISRRAIAKYRDELVIPPARLRKQL